MFLLKNAPKPKTILFVAGGGGFAWESKQILEKFDSKRVNYLVLYPDESYELRSFFEKRNAIFIKSFTHRDGFKFKHISNMFASLIKINSLLRSENISNIVGMGTSLTIAAFIIGRFYGNNALFIESMTRTLTLSSTGRLLLRMRLIDEALVQWPEMVSTDTRVVFRGNVL